MLQAFACAAPLLQLAPPPLEVGQERATVVIACSATGCSSRQVKESCSRCYCRRVGDRPGVCSRRGGVAWSAQTGCLLGKARTLRKAVCQGRSRKGLRPHRVANASAKFLRHDNAGAVELHIRPGRGQHQKRCPAIGVRLSVSYHQRLPGRHAFLPKPLILHEKLKSSLPFSIGTQSILGIPGWVFVSLIVSGAFWHLVPPRNLIFYCC